MTSIRPPSPSAARFPRALPALADAAPGAMHQAEALLSALLGSGFSGELPADDAAIPGALPPAVERFAEPLARLGIQGGDAGAVLDALRQRISGRGLTPEGAGALAQALDARSGAGASANLADAAREQNLRYLDERQKANLELQRQAQIQAEAAALITTLAQMANQAGNEIIRNMK